MAVVKKFKFPKKIGECADLLYDLRQRRLAQQKVVDDLEAEEKALKKYIIDTLPKSESSGVAGKVARVTVVTKEVPQVQDWDKFYAYVSKTKSYDLLQRRLSDEAVRSRWNEKKAVPGVEPFNVVTVSLNKL